MATYNGKVINGSLNLRKTASKSSTALASIPDGTSLVVSEYQTDPTWYSNCGSFVGDNLYAMVMDDWQARREQRNKDFANCGVDEVIAELQRQINEFVAENNITGWPDRRAAAGME